ncbi:MAG TPA: hypothetical protein VKV95_05530 [Terriglobia bacterium]|nr:hypothetical protein [Terriglobia bacterium]
MKRWAVIVVILYLCALLALTMPLLFAAFYPSMSVANMAGIFLAWPYWMAVAVMTFGQAVMLLVPVDTTFRRLNVQRSIIWPVLASGLMIGLLAGGAAVSILEFIYRDSAIDSGRLLIGLAIVPVVWLAWTLIFHRLNRDSQPMDVITRQCRILLKGSILELLVAVPTHVVARHRDYCCAGYLTFLGIAFGVATMIFSFGPGVFLLYVRRWNQIHPNLESRRTRPGQRGWNRPRRDLGD